MELLNIIAKKNKILNLLPNKMIQANQIIKKLIAINSWRDNDLAVMSSKGIKILTDMSIL